MAPQQPHDEQTIVNPVLRGFCPDPSFLRVGDDYYIATSTFEWFPGVRIHHSTDLVNWRVRGYALTRQSQLNLLGNPRSGGIWAPCLTYADGLFYLLYTDVKTWGRAFCDARNFLVTAPSIDGPWSDPIFLNASGFDPSLFHDSDGRKWLVNMRWDHRPGHAQFSGILLQEYSPAEQALVGKARLIFGGSGRGITEGPHLHKVAGRYYLLVAEGGTSWEHSVAVARSADIAGPYELDPQTPLLTALDGPGLPLQKAGHGSLVSTQDGQWYLAHLCARPRGPHRRCSLGRETAIQKLRFTEDGWFRLVEGGHHPQVRVPAPGLPLQAAAAPPARDDFDEATLGLEYQTLRRVADPTWLSLSQRRGHLRLWGEQSPQSCHEQSVVARRLQHHKARVQTSVEFEPTSFQQLAGLLCWYDDQNFYYLAVTFDEQLGKCVQLIACLGDELRVVATQPVPLAGAIHLAAAFDEVEVRFSTSVDGVAWAPVGEALDATLLSDETPTKGLGFTGTMVGMGAHDMTGMRAYGDFDYFAYHA